MYREHVVRQLATSVDAFTMAWKQPLQVVFVVVSALDLCLAGPDVECVFEVDGGCKGFPAALFEQLQVDLGERSVVVVLSHRVVQWSNLGISSRKILVVKFESDSHFDQNTVFLVLACGPWYSLR